MIRRWLQEGNPRQRITKLEAQVQALTAERDAQAQHIVDLLAENGGLHKQLNTAQSNLEVFAYRIKELEHDRDGFKLRLDEALAREKAASEQRKIVQEHLDVLSSRKPRSNSRAKPPEKEG